MLTLGIETSCDETSAAVVKDRNILSNIVASSMNLHKKYGGIVPEIATRHHVEVITRCFRAALKEAGVGLGDIGLISVTQGPGLIGSLLIGISFAKALSYSRKIPLIGVNHVIAHLWASRLDCAKPVRAPFIGLVVSGGHTSIFLVRAADDYELLGQTQDDAVGEAFDKVAKVLGLGYPGGPAIQKCAQGPAAGKGGIKFPIAAAPGNSLDFSFSGIKTAVLYHVRSRGGVEKLDKEEISEIAFAFQEAVCAAVISRVMAACRQKNIKRLVVGGGVSANSRLRRLLLEASHAGGIELFIPPLKLCVDNAAMVAALGEALFRKGARSELYLSGFANFN